MTDIKLDLGLENKEALDALKEFARSSGRFADKFEDDFVGANDKIQKETKETAGGFKSAFSGLTGVIGIAAGALAGFAGVRTLQEVTEAASIQQDAINLLNTSLKNAGTFSQEASESFQDFASDLQSVTTVGDETTLQLAALARNFTENNEQAQQLTEAAIKLSAATGIELESAVRNLGKTFGGLTGELGESVPALRNLSKEALESGEAIQFVLDRFGGSAQAQLQTFSGITTAIGNSFGDLKEEIGFAIIQNEALIIALNKLNQLFIDLGGSIKENRSILSDFVTVSVKVLSRLAFATSEIFGTILESIAEFQVALKASNIAIASVEFVFANEERRKEIAKQIELQGQLLVQAKEFATATRDTRNEVLRFTSEIVGEVEALTAANDDVAKSAKEIPKEFDKAGKSAKKAADEAAKGVEGLKRLPDALSDAAAKAQFELDQLRKAQTEYETSQLESLKTLRNAQGEYEQSLRDTAKSQQEAADSAQALLDAQKNQSIEFGKSIASSFIGGANSGSQINIGKIESEISDLNDLLTNGNITEDRRSQIQEEVLKKEQEIAAARESQLNNTTQIVSQVGGLVTDIFLPGFGGIASQLLQLFSQDSELTKQFITGFVDSLPLIIDSIAESIPVIIEAIIDRIPDIIDAISEASPKIITALVKATPRIIAKLVEETPKIAEALLRSILRKPILFQFDFSEAQEKLGAIIQDILDAIADIPFALSKAGVEFVNLILDGAQNFIGEILNGAGEFVQKIIDQLNPLDGGGSGGGGGIGGVSNQRILGGIATGGLSEVSRALGGPSFGLTGNAFGESQNSFQQKAPLSSQKFITDLSNSLAEKIGGEITNSLNEQSDRPLIIQLEVGQAQLANVLLQLNRNGFRTA